MAFRHSTILLLAGEVMTWRQEEISGHYECLQYAHLVHPP